MPRRRSSPSMVVPCQARSKALDIRRSSGPASARPGRSASSATATTSAPARASSSATCRLSGPLPQTTTRRPGSTPSVLSKRLGRARGHDAGQRPSRDRHAALVGARRDDQPAWPEQQRLRWRRDADRQRREGAPRLGAGDDLDAGPVRPVDARAPFGNLAVGRDGGGEAMRFSRLLEELSAGSGAFVDQHDAEPRLGRHRRRRQAARAAADHQQVGRAHGEVRRQDRRLAGCLLRQANGEALPANRVRSRHLGHAGALALRGRRRSRGSRCRRPCRRTIRAAHRAPSRAAR